MLYANTTGELAVHTDRVDHPYITSADIFFGYSLVVALEILESSGTAIIMNGVLMFYLCLPVYYLSNRVKSRCKYLLSHHLGCQEAASLGCQEAASLGCQEAASLGCQEAASLGCQEAASLGCQEAASLGCQEAAKVAKLPV